ncbi:MAG: TolC family protein [Candidatus Levyibacteriota bacterium]
MRRTAPFTTVLLAATLAGCASYQPLPLDTHARAPVDAADIRIDAATLPLPELRRHRFDPADGLDMTEVATLAVANNPQLRLARDERGIAQAQAFAAGLLPDPILDVSQEFPFSGPDVTRAFDLHLSYDVRALLTHSVTVDAAQAHARRIDLELLWQEWQVVGKARQLFIRDRFESQALALLERERDLLVQRHAAMEDADRRGDVSLAALATDMVALQDVERQLDVLQRKRLATDQRLNALLGLSARAKLELVGTTRLVPRDAQAVDRNLAALPRRRPDLLALEAGYRSEDARYRKAILEQFPAIDVGFLRSRDSGGTNARGFGLSLTLPLFDRNRGRIAVEQATRQRLHDEYAIRLEHARAGVRRILQDRTILRARRAEIDSALLLARQTLAAARPAQARGDMSQADYVRLEQAALDRRLERLGIDRRLQEQTAALRTLLGEPRSQPHQPGHR